MKKIVPLFLFEDYFIISSNKSLNPALITGMDTKKNFQHLFLIILLFILLFIYHLPLIKLSVTPYDEAVILVGAERILNGEIPYKDFFTQYTPGQVYTLAFLFKLFGTSVLTERIYDIVIKSLVSILIFLITETLSSKRYALIGLIFSAIWIDYSRFPAYPVYPSVLFIYIGIYLLLDHIKTKEIKPVILSALSIVFAIMYRHDLGGLSAIAFTVTFFLISITGTEKSLKPFKYFIFSMIIISIPIILYFLLYSDLKSIINDLLLFSLLVFPKYQSFPYPSPFSIDTISFYVYPFALIIGLLVSLFLLFKQKEKGQLSYGMFVISLVGLVFFNQVRVRSDRIHLLPVALTAILIIPILLKHFSRIFPLNKFLKGAMWTVFIIVFGMILYKPIMLKNRSFPEGYKLGLINPDLERSKYSIIDNNTKKVLEYIKHNTSKDEYIYVGVKNHDKLVFNFAKIYFFAERKSATKYHEFNPGLTNTRPVQEEMVKELKEKDIRLIVLTTRGWWPEPNLSRIDVKIDILDNYILNNFELKEIYGIYEIWIRKQIE